MKPGFALLFDDNGLELLHRAKAGWQTVGTAALDDDLTANLAKLRDTAAQISGPTGLMMTKLVMPRDQILVTSHQLTDPTQNVKDQVAQALIGLTPYDVADLRFDWRVDGDMVQIAAVATETLEEAENFAAEAAFNPVSYVAEPLGDAFNGEAFFGETRGASAIVGAGHNVVPDPDPTRATGPYVAPVSEPIAAVAPPAPEPEQVKTPNKTPAPDVKETPHTDTMLAGIEAQASTTSTPNAPTLTFQTTRDTPPAPTKGKSGLDQVVARVTPTLSASDPAPSQDAIKSLSFAIPKPTVPAEAPATKITVTPPPTAAAKVPPVTPPADDAATSIAPVAEPASGLTVFGARKRRERPKARAKLGLLMTVSLIILMVLIALLYRPADTTDAETTDLGGVPAVQDITADTEITTGPEVDSADFDTANMTVADAEAAYDAIGIWQRAAPLPTQPTTEDIDDLFIASIDPSITETDPIALPTPPTQSAAFLAPRVPAAAGQNFDIDASGLIVATRDGVVTPEGVTVFAGPAPMSPLPRPASILPPDEAPIVVSSQSDIRPEPRPTDIAERIVEATNDGPTRAELAGARPAPRPTALIAQRADAEAKARVEAALAAAAEADVDVTPEPVAPTATATDLAVASVTAPPSRPKGVADAAKELAESTTVTPATRQATITTPSIPSRSSVTQAATQSNVLPLRKIAVIGIFGSSGDRSALIRSANGRTSTVKVGGRVDGGRVTAISETEVRYAKGNRNLVLALPKS